MLLLAWRQKSRAIPAGTAERAMPTMERIGWRDRGCWVRCASYEPREYHDVAVSSRHPRHDSTRPPSKNF
jgi:hypothetical protein